MALDRISLTMPTGVLRELDRLAKALNRSRSWVIVEAVKQYLAGTTEPPRQAARQVDNQVAEAQRFSYAAGLGEQRLQQLESDLRLSPTERVLAAQKTSKTRPSRLAATPNRVVMFDRYEDYIAWQRVEQLVR